MRNTPIRRSTKPLRRESEKHRLKRLAEGRKARTPIKPKKRSAKAAERIYGPKEFREWIHAQPCAACGYSGLASEQAHVKGGGIGRKANWTLTLPLCRARKTYFGPQIIEGCHREQHRVGVQTFEATHGVTLLDLAAKTQARWQAHIGGGA